MQDDQLLTVAEVAKRLRLHPKTIKRWIASGRLHGVWLGSDRAGWRVPRAEVDLLVQAGQQVQPPEEQRAGKLAA